MNNSYPERDITTSREFNKRMQIVHAIDKSLDHMTISEICARAGVSRQTFYRLFSSKYDIPDWHTLYLRKLYLNEIGRTIGWRTGYYHHIRLLFEEYDFYTNSIQYRKNDPFGRSILPERRAPVLLETIEHWQHILITPRLRFTVETFARTETEVLNSWFHRRRPPDLDEWTDDILSIIPHGLYDICDIKKKGCRRGRLNARD